MILFSSLVYRQAHSLDFDWSSCFRENLFWGTKSILFIHTLDLHDWSCMLAGVHSRLNLCNWMLQRNLLPRCAFICPHKSQQNCSECKPRLYRIFRHNLADHKWRFQNFYLSFGCSFWCSNGWFIFRFCSVEIALSFHSQVNRPRNCSDGKWMGRTTILLTMHSDMMLVDTHDAPSTHHFGFIRSGVFGFSIDPSYRVFDLGVWWSGR